MEKKKQEYRDVISEVIFDFVVVPLVILLGMFIVGAIMDLIVDTRGTFAKAFLYVGGTLGVAAYYYRMLVQSKVKR